jgi:F0F1-type ATP synthase assembly protein I
MWRAAASVGALGIEIAAEIVIGTGVGYYLDRKLNTHWIMYLGLFFGLGAAVKSLVRVTREAKRAFPDDKPGSGQSGGNRKSRGNGAGPS